MKDGYGKKMEILNRISVTEIYHIEINIGKMRIIRNQSINLSRFYL